MLYVFVIQSSAPPCRNVSCHAKWRWPCICPCIWFITLPPRFLSVHFHLLLYAYKKETVTIVRAFRIGKKGVPPQAKRLPPSCLQPIPAIKSIAAVKPVIDIQTVSHIINGIVEQLLRHHSRQHASRESANGSGPSMSAMVRMMDG